MEAQSKSQSDGRSREITYLITEDGQEVEVGVLARRIPVYTDKHGKAYIPFLDERAINWIVAQIIELVKDGFDVIIMITGARRKGKSTLGVQIARKVSETFSVDDVAFRLQNFSDLLDKNPYADPDNGILPQAFYDESGVGVYSKEWWSEWIRELVKCLEVIGMKRQICYFILPHAKKLTGDIRDEMATYWIDVDTKYRHERGYAEFYTGVRDKFKQAIWWKPKFAFKFNPLVDEFWSEYEKKKKTFIDDMAAQKKDDLTALVAGELSKGKTPREIADEQHIGLATVYRYKAKASL